MIRGCRRLVGASQATRRNRGELITPGRLLLTIFRRLLQHLCCRRAIYIAGLRGQLPTA
jgi:hypothetical protein